MTFATPATGAVIVTDAGFGPEHWSAGFTPADEAAPGAPALELGPEADPDALALEPAPHIIRIRFPSFSDGRGFTLARRLRARGYRGILRAAGHVIADQYAMARRCGFDEVEIPADLAARQPQDQWQSRANWQEHDPRARLHAGA